MKWNRFQYRNIRVHPLSNVASWVVPNALTCFLFADVKRSASTAQDSELTRVASANEEWKSSEDSSSRNLWLDTLDTEHEDFVTSDEDQNDLDESNVSSHGNTFFKSWITVFLVSVFCCSSASTLNYAWNIMCQKQFGQLIRHFYSSTSSEFNVSISLKLFKKLQNWKFKNIENSEINMCQKNSWNCTFHHNNFTKFFLDLTNSRMMSLL